MIGADVAELRRVAQLFDDAAQELSGITVQVERGVEVTAWVGPFSAHWKATWKQQDAHYLRDSAAQLADAAGQLRAQAEQQEKASQPGGGASKSQGSTSSSFAAGGGGGGGGGGWGLTPSEQIAVEAGLDPSAADAVKTGLDLHGKADLATDILSVAATGKLPTGGSVSVFGAAKTAIDLYDARQELWDDIQSGSPVRFTKAISSTGWMLAQQIPGPTGFITSCVDALVKSTAVQVAPRRLPDFTPLLKVTPRVSRPAASTQGGW